MIIECYFSKCEFHSANYEDDEGPFCYERECQATPEQIVVFTKQRDEQLAEYYKELDKYRSDTTQSLNE